MAAKNQPRFRILNGVVNEVSFVDKGDNPGAPVRFFKRAGGEAGEPDPPLEDDLVIELDEPGASRLGKLAAIFKSVPPPFTVRTTAEILASERFRDEFWKLRSAFLQSVDTILDLAPGEEMAAALGKTVGEFTARARELTDDVTKGHPNLGQDLLDILDRLDQTVAGKGADVTKRHEDFEKALADLEGFEPPDPPEEDMARPKKTLSKRVTEILAKMDEGVRKELEEALAEEAAATPPAPAEGDPAPAAEGEPAAPAAAAPEGEPAETEKVLKGLDPEARALVEKAIAKAEKAEKKADDLEKAAKEASYLQKAKDMGIEGVEKAKIVKTFHAAEKIGGEEGEAIVDTLKALSAQAKKGGVLMDSIGKFTPDAAEGDAEAAIVKGAKDLQKAKPELSYEEAYSQFMQTEEGRALYSQMEADAA